MPKKKNWATRLKKDIQSVLKGAGHSPAGKKYTKAQAAKGKVMKKGKFVKTMATKGVEKRLRYAGLTQKEIDRLGGR